MSITAMSWMTTRFWSSCRPSARRRCCTAACWRTAAAREIACAPETPREDWRKLEGIPDEGQYPLENPDQIPGCAWIPPIKPQLIEVAEGDLTLDEFMSLLSDEDMARLYDEQASQTAAWRIPSVSATCRPTACPT